MSDEAGALAAHLRGLVEEVGPDLEDVVVQRAGRRRLVRVVVDADGGVGADDLADVSRAVSEALDDEAALPADVARAVASPWTLEVTSPGTDRPLVEPRHWRRAVGRLVKVRLAAGGETTGRLLAVDDDGAVLHLDVDGAVREVRRDDVASARVQVEMRPRDAGRDPT